MSAEHLSQKQIQQLLNQGCSSDDWTGILLSPDTDISRIRHTHFVGPVTLAGNAGAIDLRGSLLPCGIYHATVSDCHIGQGVRIANVRTILAGYDIEEGACIQDIGLMTAEPGAAFGNGVEIEVVNEAGGRGVTLHNGMTAQVAFLQAIHRHDAALTTGLRTLISNECTDTAPGRGRVGRQAHVIGCGSLHNVVIGPYARLEGCALLENGTANSCAEHPTTLGQGVHARDFVIAEGARVDSSAILDRVFVGQGVKMGKQFSAENSLFFANCEAFHGEAVALFAGPYTVTHHKSTLMIAGLFSFYNAGSGTNQSNHMYKLGPVHQGVFERGCKTGSFSYVLYESHVGAFSVVIGKHFANIRTPNFPFSYISEKGGESTIVPGMNLFSVGTVRDGEKWPKRDNRKVPEKRDLITFDVFSPYTVERMRRGREELLALNEITAKDRQTVNVGGVQMSRVLLRKGAKYYASAVTRYLVDRVVERLMAALASYPAWAKATSALKPETSLQRASEWADLCGLLAPSELVQGIEQRITSGSLRTLDELRSSLKTIHERYREYEWQYVYETFEKEFGYRLSSIPKEQALKTLEEWKKASLTIQSAILEDSKKEFGPFARVGFGLDLNEGDAEADFTAVRGTIEGNGVVQKLNREGEQITRRFEEITRLIDATP
jgi:Domain of unknown function (DUF4954)/Domain of unknown function (DUF6819)